jgi:hypothetical protein
MALLNAGLQQAVTVWRTELKHAELREHPELNESEVAERELSALVTYIGDVEAPRAPRSRDRVRPSQVICGRRPLRDVDRLASVPEVWSIPLEPPTRIVLGKAGPGLSAARKEPPRRSARPISKGPLAQTDRGLVALTLDATRVPRGRRTVDLPVLRRSWPPRWTEADR